MELIELLFTRFFLKAQQFIFKCILDFLCLYDDEYLCLESCILQRLCLLCIVNSSCKNVFSPEDEHMISLLAHYKSTHGIFF